MNSYYVYGYTDPTSSDPYFYIGKGHGDRYLDHFQWNLLKQQTHFYKRLRNLLLKDIVPIVSFLKSNLTEQEALAFEIETIAKHGRIDLGTGCLCNHTEGGDGVSGMIHTEETRQKIRVKRAQQVMIALPIDAQIALCYAATTPKVNLKRRETTIKVRGHPVVAINPETGKIVHSFDCIKDAGKKGFQPSVIHKVLNGERNLHRGYFWKDA